MANFYKYSPDTFNFEGGFQKNASDSGNYCSYYSNGTRYRGALIGTMYGISAIAFQEAYGYCPTETQLRALTKEQALSIYKKNYWDKWISADKINDEVVAYMSFTCIIGALTNIKVVRAAINKVSKKYNKGTLVTDAVPFNDISIKLINSLPPKELFATIWTDYLAYLKGRSTASVNPGWFVRMDAIKDIASKYYKSNITIPKMNASGAAIPTGIAFTAFFLLTKFTIDRLGKSSNKIKPQVA